MNTIEKNKLIAEFMINDMRLITPHIQYYPNESWDKGVRTLYNPTFDDDDLESFEYHTSWDWLMPVLERIRLLGDGYSFELTATCGCTDCFTCCNIQYPVPNPSKMFPLNTKRKTITISSEEDNDGKLLTVSYLCIIEFIKTYNSVKLLDESESSEYDDCDSNCTCGCCDIDLN